MINRDTVTRLAKQSGLMGPDDWLMNDSAIERFANLIAQESAALASRQAPEDRPDCYCICGTRPHYGAAKYDRAKKEASALRGECNVLAGIIRDCDAVLATIEPENDDEAERLSDLRTAITYALDPYKREGTLL